MLCFYLYLSPCARQTIFSLSGVSSPLHLKNYHALFLVHSLVAVLVRLLPSLYLLSLLLSTIIHVRSSCLSLYVLVLVSSAQFCILCPQCSSDYSIIASVLILFRSISFTDDFPTLSLPSPFFPSSSHLYRICFPHIL